MQDSFETETSTHHVLDAKKSVADVLMDKPKRRRRRRFKPLRVRGMQLLFVLPVVAWIILVLEGPFIYAIDRSLRFFSLADPNQNGQWAGLSQYSKLMHDPQLRNSFVTTLKFAVPAVGIQLVAGTAIALLFYQVLRDRPWASRIALTFFLIPLMASEPVTALTWKFLLQGDFGVLTYLLTKSGVSSSTSFLSDPDLVIPSLVVVDVWQWVPFVTIIIYAGLVALPREPIEAAQVDGATYWQRVRHVLLPPLLPLFSVVLLFRSIDAFNVMGKVQILTGGGPGQQSEVLSLYAYRQGFEFLDQAYASAIVMVMFGLVFIVVDIWFKVVYGRIVR